MTISTSQFPMNVRNDNARISPTSIREQQKTKEDEQQIEQLKQRDREVRAHEAAHQSAAGGYSRGMSFTYQIGPDGQRYAIGGEVKIDMSPVPNNPEATIQKMQVVQRAALAPSDPSPQDRAVAAAARSIEQQARRQLLEQQRNELEASTIPSQNGNKSFASTIQKAYKDFQEDRSFFYDNVV